MENISDIGTRARWKRLFIFSGGFALIMLIGASAFFGVRYYRYRQGYLLPMERYEAYMDIFRNDTYGGQTPEETLQLFVAALRAGDVEKASLYFMPDDRGSREKWAKILEDNKSDFTRIADVLATSKRLSSSDERQVWLQSFEGDKERLVDMVFNGKVWKIESL